MTDLDLKKANELIKLIEKTEEALENLRDWRSKSTMNSDPKEYKDCNYNLFMSEYDDGSGLKVFLSRYFGNTDLLCVIIDTLQTQVEGFKKAFREL
jgi:hypothetical protein